MCNHPFIHSRIRENLVKNNIAITPFPIDLQSAINTESEFFFLNYSNDLGDEIVLKAVRLNLMYL